MPSELADRAISYLSQRGTATSAELAGYVFGGEAFVSLLPSLHDERLVQVGELWSLAAPADEWASLEILTSGPNPRRHRIIELAALRGTGRFHALVASTAPVPKLLQRLGLPAHSDGAQSLDNVTAALRAFLGSTTVVGFSYAPAFLKQLLGPDWPAVDLLQLLYHVSYFDGRPDPERLARHFDLPIPPNRRPGSLLDFSSALFERLRGTRSLAEMRELAAPRAAEPPVVPKLPAQPGVYVMATSSGDPLYVGKSVDLKSRVSSYIGRPIAESRGLYHLTQLTDRIEVIPVNSELEALVLESRLIADWQPAFNVQRQTGRRHRYLRLSTDEPFPRLTTAAAPDDDDATYFGPFRHAAAAQRLQTLLSRVLRLRTCSRQLPSRRKPRPACEKADAGRCLAPCVPGPPPEPYSRELELTRELLSASPQEFRRILLQLLRERPPEPGAARRLRKVLESLAAPDQPLIP